MIERNPTDSAGDPVELVHYRKHKSPGRLARDARRAAVNNARLLEEQAIERQAAWARGAADTITPKLLESEKAKQKHRRDGNKVVFDHAGFLVVDETGEAHPGLPPSAVPAGCAVYRHQSEIGISDLPERSTAVDRPEIDSITVFKLCMEEIERGGLSQEHTAIATIELAQALGLMDEDTEYDVFAGRFDAEFRRIMAGKWKTMLDSHFTSVPDVQQEAA